MTFSVLRLAADCEPNCPEWIAAEGEITGATPGRLSRLLANPEYRNLPIVLNSAGGSIEAAMSMGHMIRNFGMNTAVARSSAYDCMLNQSCQTMGSAQDRIHLGMVEHDGGVCNSACTLMLLAGVDRIAGPSATVGLHEPHQRQAGWIDHYWDTWKITNGKKQLISHRFVNRTYLRLKAPDEVLNELRPKYMAYFREMGGSPQLLDEMAKATPRQMNNIPFAGGRRTELGLITNAAYDMSDLVSPTHCTNPGKFTSNCVAFSSKVIALPALPVEKCFVMGGCNTAPKAEPAKCFVQSGCK